MSEDSVPEKATGEGVEPAAQSGRKKRKVRIKYRERVRVKQRPKGNKIIRHLKKNRNKVLSYIILISLLSATLFMLGKLAVQRVEMNKMQKDLNIYVPE